MASEETNDKKRIEMSILILGLGHRGWSAAQIAAWMGVTPNTVHTWRRGDSMGTNLQRAELAKLKSPVEERERIRAAIVGAQREALTSENMLEEDAARFPTHAGGSNYRRAQARIARIRDRAETLAKLFGF